MRIFDRIDYTVRILSAILLGLMTLLVLIQVFWRYVLNTPLGEPLELSVMCMVWATMLGTASAVRNKSHIAVTMLADAVPPTVRRVMTFVTYGVMLIVFYLISTEGWTVVLRGMRQMSTITGIPHGYVALSIPVCGWLSVVYILEHVWKEIRGTDGPQRAEVTPDA